MNFLDWFKTKPTPKLAREPAQTAQALQLHREFAEHPSKGLTPAKLADVLLDAERGDLKAQAELFKDIEEKDSHVCAEMGKRKMAVKKLTWQLKPPRNASAAEKQRTADLEALIRDELDVGDLVFDMLDGIGHGYSCQEIEWGRNSQGLWVPADIQYREPSWFTTPQHARNELRLRSLTTVEGEPLRPFGWVAHFHKSRSGYIARSGLYRSLIWPYLYKNYSVRDLAEFLEVYGLPIRIGKYPANADDAAKRTLMQAVLSIGHHAAGIIPDSMQIELQQVMASGNADAFRTMIDWCEASQSKAILGGTLTSSTAANGNRSLGDVHNEVRSEIRDDDAAQCAETLSGQLLYPIALLNEWFADNRAPSWWFDTEEADDLALYAESLPKLVAVGQRIPQRWVAERLRIPEPEGDEPILMMGQAAPVAPTQALAALSPNIDPDVDPTPVESQAEQLARLAGPSLKAMVGTIADKVDKASSLEALRDDLLNSYADLDNRELVQVMALAFAAADLAGRFDVDAGG